MNKMDKLIISLLTIIGIVLVAPLLVIIHLFNVILVTCMAIKYRYRLKEWYKRLVEMITNSIRSARLILRKIYNGEQV